MRNNSEGSTNRRSSKTKIRKVSNYLLLKPIGKGSFSTVWEGKVEGTSRQVAIKVFNLTNCRKRDYERVQFEAKVLSLIRHENIVELLDVKQSARNLYLIFEHCQNTDLDGYIRRYYGEWVPEDIARKIFQQLKKAFVVLRSHRVSHRDLKLANILVTSDFKIKVGDFGFARLLQDDELFSSVVGTPLTMAPQVLFHKDYDEKCDIWSLGVMLYQMLQGRSPFLTPDNMTLQALKQGILKDQIVFRQDIIISQEVKNLMIKMIVREPAERMTFEQFFKHPWLKEETLTIPSLQEQAFKKQLNLYVQRSKASKIQFQSLCQNIQTILYMKIFYWFKSMVENRLYSFVCITKKIIKRLENAAPEERKPIVLGLILLRLNIKEFQENSIMLQINQNRTLMQNYNTIKDVESPTDTQFSKGIPLLVRKAKTLIKQSLIKFSQQPWLNCSLSINQHFLQQFLKYLSLPDHNSQLSSQLVKIKKIESSFKINLTSIHLSKQLIDLLTDNKKLQILSQLQFNEEQLKIFKEHQSLFKIDEKTSTEAVDTLYEQLKEIV